MEKIFEKHGFADLFVKESVQKQEVVTAAATVDMRDLLDEDGSDDDIQGVVSNEEGDGKEMTMLSPDMISKPDEFFENMKNNIRFPHQDRNRKANTPEEYQLEAGHPLIDKAKPKNHYTIAGVDYYISDPFTVYKRKAFSLYVKFPDDDQYYARVAYKSGSNNVWRTVSNYVNGWFGKGRETEESVTFPHQMQGILEQLSRDEDIEFENGDLDEDKKPGELLFGSLVAWDISVSDTFVYDADKVREDEDRTKKIGGFIGEGPESYQYFEGYEPDYSSVKEDDRFKVFSQTLDRDIDAYVLDSENGELSYLFYHDAENDVTWIGSVQVKEIDFNRYGVNENTISSSCLEVHNMRAGKIKDNLIMPGYEYGSQIPDGYAGDRTKGSYCDASKYTHKLPPVAGFREEVLGLEPEAGVVRQDFSHTTQVGLDTTMMRRQAQEIKERDREAKRKKRVYHIFEKIFTEDELRAGITIGRSKGNDIEIVDEAVSREHAVIILRGENIVLQDMESTNGTVVDSTRVKDGAEELIKPGAVLSIMLGDKQFAKSEFTSYRPVTNKTKKLKKSEEYFFEIDGEFIDSSYFHEEQILAGIITMVLDDDGLFFKHDSNQDILINGVKLLKGQRCKLKPGDKFKIDDSEESEFKIYIKDNK